MAYKMDPEKSGVMIYFSPMRKVAEHLDDARLGQLFRGILNYADPDSQTEPDFQDEALIHDWLFLHDAIVRDDKTYHGKSLVKKYAAFCRYAKDHGYGHMDGPKYVPPITRLRWDELGGPTFLEWERMLKNADASGAMQTDAHASSAMHVHTGASSAMQVDADAMQMQAGECTRIPVSDTFPYSNSIPASSATAEAVSASPAQRWEPERREAAETPESVSVFPFPSPALHNAYIRWIMHWEQVTKKNLPESSRNSLAKEFRSYADEYGVEAVDALITEAVSSAYKSIPWDRLERRRAQAASASSGANVGNGGADAMDTLRELHEKFMREDGT